jgi:alpha-L-rhamnosidase
MYHIYAMKCCGIRDPEGIDRIPDFSWKLSTDKRNITQDAYRISVTDQKGKMVWDSGICFESATHRICYAGSELQSLKKYFWRVVSYADNGEIARSSWGCFSTGILRADEWEAKWVEPDFDREPIDDKTDLHQIMSVHVEPEKKPEKRLNPGIYFRKETVLNKAIQGATAVVSAHGVYSLYVNGKEIGQPLAPGYTVYEQYTEYQTYDITNALREGSNVIGAIVEDGWYLGKLGLLGIGNQYGNQLALLIQIQVMFEDGTEKKIVTDSSWIAGPGAYLYADLYIGEGFDERKNPVGWQFPGYRNSLWKPVKEKNYGYSQLKGRSDEPVRYLRIQKAKELFYTPGGDLVLDVGENIAGYISVRGNSVKDTRITLEYAEVLDEFGNFIHNIIGQNKDQTDVYITGSDGTFFYRPTFTFHGFRYVRIRGISHPLISDFQVYVLGSDLERTGEFACSDNKLNRLQENIFRSQQGNMIYIPTDCPQREKSGFTGDMQVYTPTAAFLMDVESFLGKWLSNMRCDQLPDGEIPDTVPSIPASRLIHEFACSSGWGDACVIVPYRLYMAYGDLSVLRDNYSMMLRWMQYVEHRAETQIPESLKNADPERLKYQKYLWNTDFHFGDWLIPSLSGKGMTNPMEGAELTKELVAPAMYAYSASLMIRICQALGKKDMEEHFKLLLQNIQIAYLHEYVTADGRLKVEYQGIYVLALQMNLVTPDKREAVFQRLVELIEKNGYCLDTGFLSMPFLLDVLYENGRKDLAYKLLYQEKCPSWLYEVNKGASTIWESWTNISPDGEVTNASYNHFAFGCVGDFIYRRILGLIPQTPGYDNVIISPDLECGLEWVKGSFESVHGLIDICWTRKNNKGLLEVTLPPNTQATVIFHNKQYENIGSGYWRFEADSSLK